MRDDIQIARTAPMNLEAEQALLGAILINNEAYDRVSGFLEPAHFFDPLHSAIYAAIATLVAAGRLANPVTLRSFFEGAEPIGGVPVPAYLGQLAANATTIINVCDYAHVIRDLATRRQLILIGEDMVNAAYDSPLDLPAKQQIEDAETRLYSLAEHGHGERLEIEHAAALDAAVKLVEEAYRNPGALAGLSTGLADLDKRIGGLRPGHLIVVGGRPSMGKSSLANTILDAQTDPTLFFSLEMTSEEVALRELAAETGIASDAMTRGDLSEEQIRRVITAQAKLSKRPLTVVEASGLTIAQVSTMARRIKRQKGIKLIVIDYLQLMQGTRRANRVEDVTEITVGLKALAKELGIPVVALSQLSRAVESRSDKRPMLADLRESGSIEQDADEVLLVFREEYYLERAEPPKGTPEHAAWQAKIDDCRGIAEIIVAKSRHGRVGTVESHFDGPTTRFSDLAR